MSRYDTPLQDYDETTNTATYNAEDVEHMIDTGIFIECPECGEQSLLDEVVSKGCYNDACGRGPWSVVIEQ
jgi:uncharacterized protein (DUF983 family)